MVNEETALKVANEERQTFQDIMKVVSGARGFYDEARMQLAVEKGLSRIVYKTREKGRFMFVTDLLTHERWKVPLSKWGSAGKSWYDREDADAFKILSI